MNDWKRWLSDFNYIYTRSVQKVSSHVIWKKYRHLLKKLQDTRNIIHGTMTSQSPSKEAPWDLTLFSQFTLSYFTESHWWSEMSSLLKVILVWGKAKSLRAPNLGCRGAESPGWIDASPKTLHETRCMHERVCFFVTKLPVTSCSLLWPPGPP